MSYEKAVMERARLRYQEDVEAHRKLQRERLDRAYREYPRLQELDREIRQTMADVMRTAFQYGRNPAEAMQEIQKRNLDLQQRRTNILKRAGYSEEYLEEGPKCKKCGDSGYLGSEMCSCFARYCREEQQKELTSLLRSTCSFDDFQLEYYSDQVDPLYGVSPRAQMEMVYEYCVTYAWRFGLHSPNLLLCGGTGLGKTFLSGCIAREAVGKGFSVVYDTAIHLFTCLEDRKFGRADEEELRMAQRLEVCDLCIVDDLGTEMTSQFVVSALYSLINGRMLAGKPTIISTNLSMDMLKKRYSQPIISRLEGEYNLLTFIGEDIRKIRARQ